MTSDCCIKMMKRRTVLSKTMSSLMSRFERNFYGKLKQTSVVTWSAFKDNRQVALLSDYMRVYLPCGIVIISFCIYTQGKHLFLVFVSITDAGMLKVRL